MSDVLINRNDALDQQTTYDSLSDDPSFARRMLRRAAGKEATRLIGNSELKPLYTKMGNFFKQAAEVFTVREDVGISKPKTIKAKSSSRSSGKKLLSLGVDASNEFSPTIKVLERFEFAYEPFSDRVTTQIRLDF